MTRYIIRRLLLGVPLVIMTVVITFLLIHLAPGDPALMLTGDQPAPEFLEQVREKYGLNDPVPAQLVTYLGNAATGDFGTSIHYNQPVHEVILERLPNTLLLTFAALSLATVAGTFLGVVAANWKDTWIDSGVSAFSLVGYSTPLFWLAQIFVLVFAIRLGVLPASGMEDLRADYTGVDRLVDIFKHMILPVVTLAVFLMGMIARFTRTAMVESLSEDYIAVAHAKGLTNREVLFRHALRNALLTTVTVVGLQFGALLAGAVVTESIFAWPGIGRLFFDAIARRDFPLLSGIFIFASVGVVLVNLITDLIYGVLDPRVSR